MHKNCSWTMNDDKKVTVRWKHAAKITKKSMHELLLFCSSTFLTQTQEEKKNVYVCKRKLLAKLWEQKSRRKKKENFQSFKLSTFPYFIQNLKKTGMNDEWQNLEKRNVTVVSKLKTLFRTEEQQKLKVTFISRLTYEDSWRKRFPSSVAA